MNKYQYNGIELINDFGLHANHALYRTLDPQRGQWWQIDPKAEEFYGWSPYHSNMDNPVRYQDPEGDCPLCLVPVIVGLWLASEPVKAPSMNREADEAAMQQAWKEHDEQVISAIIPTGKAGGNTVSATLNVVKKEVGKEVKEGVKEKAKEVTQKVNNSKNERHGDGGRKLSQAEKKIEELTKQMEGATKKESNAIKQKIKNIRESAEKSKKGEEHSRGNKR